MRSRKDVGWNGARDWTEWHGIAWHGKYTYLLLFFLLLASIYYLLSFRQNITPFSSLLYHCGDFGLNWTCSGLTAFAFQHPEPQMI